MTVLDWMEQGALDQGVAVSRYGYYGCSRSIPFFNTTFRWSRSLVFIGVVALAAMSRTVLRPIAVQAGRSLRTRRSRPLFRCRSRPR